MTTKIHPVEAFGKMAQLQREVRRIEFAETFGPDPLKGTAGMIENADWSNGADECGPDSIIGDTVH